MVNHVSQDPQQNKKKLNFKNKLKAYSKVKRCKLFGTNKGKLALGEYLNYKWKEFQIEKFENKLGVHSGRIHI